MRDRRALLGAFALLGVTSFGGWLAYFHDAFVDKRRWLTDQEYLEGAAISNIVPGASFLNFAIFASHRLGGWGMVPICAALILAPGAVLMLLLSMWYGSNSAHLPIVMHAMRGLAAAAAGLVVLTPIRLLRSQAYGVQNLLIAAATFAGLALLHLPMLAVVLPMIAAAVWVNRPTAENAS